MEDTLPQCYARLASTGLIERLLTLARDEDLHPTGHDATTDAMALADTPLRAALTLRQGGILAGLAAVPDLVRIFGGGIAFEPLAADGQAIPPGTSAGILSGPAPRVLRIERTLLNLIARLSGVATRTGAFVQAVEGTGARICDTRKTTPGLRALEKYAVRCGGGTSHRMSLADAVLIKDNHLAGLTPPEVAIRVTAAATRARQSAGAALAFVEVEVDSLQQLDALLGLPAGLIDYILLDNFTLGDLREAVARRGRAGSAVVFEASGGIGIENVRAVAETGVERISIGGLTHQAVSLDVGLDAEG